MDVEVLEGLLKFQSFFEAKAMELTKINLQGYYYSYKKKEREILSRKNQHICYKCHSYRGIINATRGKPFEEVVKYLIYDPFCVCLHDKSHPDNRGKHLNLDVQDELMPHAEKFFQQCGSSLAELTILKLYDSNILPIVCDNCQNLKRLKLKFKEYFHDDFFNVFSDMKKLKRIDIFQTHGTFNSHCLESLNENIGAIALTRRDHESSNDTPDLLASTFNKFKDLAFLRLDRYNLTKDVIESITQKESLIYLRLNDCLILDGLPLLTNIIYLEGLCLQSIQTVDNSFLTKLALNCEILIHIDLSGCKNFDDDGLVKLAKLQYVEILCVNSTNISDEPLSKFIYLKKLECSDCKNVKDLGICKLLLRSSEIESITTDGTSVSEFINGLMTLHGLTTTARINLTKKFITANSSLVVF